MVNQVVAAVDRRHHINLAVHRFVAVACDGVALVFGWLPLTSAGRRCGATVRHRLRRRVRWASTVHLVVAEQDVAANRVCYHRGSGVVGGLSKESRMSIARACRCVADYARP